MLPRIRTNIAAAALAAAVGIGALPGGLALTSTLDARNGTAAGEDAAAKVLGAKSPVRVFLRYKSDQIRLPDGTVSALQRRHARIHKDIDPVMGRYIKAESDSSAPPPADWVQPDFDDSSWPVTLAPVHTSVRRLFDLLCARLSFKVDDPAAAKDLKLSLAYRGGVVVYLNGKEFTRSHMPTRCGRSPDRATLLTEGLQTQGETFGRRFRRGRETRVERV